MTTHLYRVHITRYPDGAAHRIYHADGEKAWELVPGWAPPGWTPEGNYTKMLGTSEFVWPSTKQIYRSRSTAKKRAELIESFGATAVIERSSRINWEGWPTKTYVVTAKIVSGETVLGVSGVALLVGLPLDHMLAYFDPESLTCNEDGIPSRWPRQRRRRIREAATQTGTDDLETALVYWADKDHDAELVMEYR